MPLRNIRASIAKLLLPIFYFIFKILKENTRVKNFVNNKIVKANDNYNFIPYLKKILGDKKIVGVDVGAQGGFNSDEFFPKKYNDLFETILVDPLENSIKPEDGDHLINKGLWSSNIKKKLYILNGRPGSSSLYEPERKFLSIYDIDEKNFHLFDVSKTVEIECEKLSTSLEKLKIKSLDYLKIDTQGAELEILKGLDNYKPLMIKCELQIFPMYKNEPVWSEVLNYLYMMGYMISDWRKIGSHATRTPVEMDMLFIPRFFENFGENLIKDKQDEFISLMLISGQIKLLKKISKILDLNHKKLYMNLEDKYYN